MGDVLEFLKYDVLERGDHAELSERIIDVDEHESGERPVTDIAGIYHVFDRDSGMWVPQQKFDLACRADKFAGCGVATKKEPRPLKVKASDGPAVAEMVRMHTYAPNFFKDDHIAFRNGWVARVKGSRVVFEKLRAEHGARVALPIDYNSEWELPPGTLLERYLATTFDDDDDRWSAVELMGAALLGLGPRFKKAFFLTDGELVEGQGGTGKSQLLEILLGLVPKSRTCSIAPQDFAHEYHGAGLLGKTLNVVFEAPDTELLREEGVKAIIHGEVIRRRPIRQDPIEFAPIALNVWSVNRLPDAPGATGAFWDRFRVLPFNNRFRDTSDAIKDIGARIVAEEFEHVTHWALLGAQRLLDNGNYSQGAGSFEAFVRWKTMADPIAHFVADECEREPSESPQLWIEASRLYQAYKDWCMRVGHKPCSLQKFGRRIPSEVEKSRSGGVSRYRLNLIGN